MWSTLPRPSEASRIASQPCAGEFLEYRADLLLAAHSL
jgi:hypothetical protein